jgi:hypothetical protein
MHAYMDTYITTNNHSAMSRGLQRRALHTWTDEAREKAIRMQSLHALLKALELRWKRRFFRNHFLAWKFTWSQTRATGNVAPTLWTATYVHTVLRGGGHTYTHVLLQPGAVRTHSC